MSAGGSRANVVKVSILLVDINDFAKVNEIMASRFAAPVRGLEQQAEGRVVSADVRYRPRRQLLTSSRTGATTWAGTSGAFVMGLRHGLFCVGCCWALMALLFVGGVMNVAWIAALSVTVAFEKLLPRGQGLALVLGLVLIGIGCIKLLALSSAA